MSSAGNHDQTHRGLSYWMSRTQKLVARAAKESAEETIHDLRVALRRCRSMADGMMALDDHKDWSRMKKEGGRLFDRLGELRDIHVLQGWLEKLVSKGDPLREVLEERLSRAENAAESEVAIGLRKFDQRAWRQWSRRLPTRVRLVPPNGLVFQHLTLTRYEAAHALHHDALRMRSRAGWHQLRLGIKRFRYCVENFLPGHHEQWGSALKRVQDLLGGVHDLDVFRELLGKERKLHKSAQAARERALEERTKRLADYKQLANGDSGLWTQWRNGLPHGAQLETAAFAWFRTWAAFRDEDWQRRRALVRLALNLFDEMHAARVNDAFAHQRHRRLLYAAALTENVGRREGWRGHHKESFRLVREMDPPAGWTKHEMLIAALIARYHRGAGPRPGQKGFKTLTPAEQAVVSWLAATLRLADGLVSCCKSGVTKLRVESSGGIHIFATGLEETEARSELLAEKQDLLIKVSGRSVFIHRDRAKTKTLAAT